MFWLAAEESAKPVLGFLAPVSYTHLDVYKRQIDMGWLVEYMNNPIVILQDA